MYSYINKEKSYLINSIISNTDISKVVAQKLIRTKQVLVDGVRINQNVEIQSALKIEIFYTKKTQVKTEFNTIYVDDNILVVYKQKGIESVSENQNKKSMQKLINTLYPQAQLMHRLDTNTDGLLIFSLNQNSYDSLFKAFKERTLDKYYVAKVYSKQSLPKKADFIDYMSKDEQKGYVKITKNTNDKKAHLSYEIMKNKDDVFLLNIKLYTGLTHQIRAQLSHHKIYILGDGKYGDKEANKKYNCKKLQLTAYKIIFNFANNDYLYYLNNKEIKIKYQEEL